MNSTRQAIGQLLDGDATLGALATGGVFFSVVADQDAEMPYVVFHYEGGTEEWALQGNGIERDRYQVKGISPRADIAEDIDERCRVLLDNADLGGDHLFCRREAGVSYSTVDDGLPIHYRGSIYRVVRDA